jgi:hypothetical protein
MVVNLPGRQEAFRGGRNRLRPGRLKVIASELLDELRLTRRDFSWQYCGVTRKIRGRLKSEPKGQFFDPIGAVCYSRTGLIFQEDDWFKASEKIELNHIDAGILTAASNTMCRRANQKLAKVLRHKMIEGLHLAPEAAEATLAEIPYYIKAYVTEMLAGIRSPA